MLDKRNIAPNVNIIILENGIDNNILDSGDLFSIRGSYITVGDWDYQPNREMLRMVLNWAEQSTDIRKRGLRIHGPNLADKNIPCYARYIPWVEDSEEIYRDAYALLAPMETGAGVKNKVIESIAVGIPVVGTFETFTGIQEAFMAACFILELDDGSLIDMLLKNGLLDSHRKDAATQIRVQTWDNTVKTLVNWWLS